MPQVIVAPSAEDIDRIAKQLLHADSLVTSAAGVGLSGAIDDLTLIQQTLESGIVGREDTYSLQALGISLGKVLVNLNPEYDWWIVEDEYGRDPAIRYKHTSLLAFPQTMISKRVEDGQPFSVPSLYRTVLRELEVIRDKHYTDA